MLTERKHQGKTVTEKDGYSIIECQHCGFIHIYPYPAQDEIVKIYHKDLYHGDKPDYLKKAETEYDYWQIVYKKRYQKFEDLLGRGSYGDNSLHLLDVGSSGGFFLTVGKQLGWETIGIEPSLKATEYARKQGCRVFNGFIDQFAEQSEQFFHVIHLSYVLEHIPYPIQLCQLAFELLHDGGILCIEVPNDYSPLQEIAMTMVEKRQWWLSVPLHLNYFNVASIKKLVARCGFSIACSFSSFPMEFFLLWGENYIDNPSLGPGCHQKRMALEKKLYRHKPELLEDLYQVLAKHGCGRSTIIFCKKNK